MKFQIISSILIYDSLSPLIPHIVFIILNIGYRNFLNYPTSLPDGIGTFDITVRNTVLLLSDNFSSLEIRNCFYDDIEPVRGVCMHKPLALHVSTYLSTSCMVGRTNGMKIKVSSLYAC